MMEYAKLYPIDAAFDRPKDVPASVWENKRYAKLSHYEVTKNLLDTSRQGYLAAMSASSYSFVSLLAHFGPILPKDASALTLSYIASMRAILGYGGGMSSAKAALESDTRTLAWEAGRKWGAQSMPSPRELTKAEQRKQLG